jgi:hypothetical protein
MSSKTVPKPVIDDWSLNMGKILPQSCSFQSPHRGMCSRIGLGNKYD